MRTLRHLSPFASNGGTRGEGGQLPAGEEKKVPPLPRRKRARASRKSRRNWTGKWPEEEEAAEMNQEGDRERGRIPAGAAAADLSGAPALGATSWRRDPQYSLREPCLPLIRPVRSPFERKPFDRSARWQALQPAWAPALLSPLPSHCFVCPGNGAGQWRSSFHVPAAFSVDRDVAAAIAAAVCGPLS